MGNLGGGNRFVVGSASIASTGAPAGSPDAIRIRIDRDQLATVADHAFEPAPASLKPPPTCPLTPELDDRGEHIELTLHIQIKTLDGRRLITSPEGEPLVIAPPAETKQHIIDAIGLAYRWHDELIKSGQHVREFATSNGIARSRVFRLLRLTQLGPPVLRAVFDGALPNTLTLNDLLAAAEHLDWQCQATELGINAPK